MKIKSERVQKMQAISVVVTEYLNEELKKQLEVWSLGQMRQHAKEQGWGQPYDLELTFEQFDGNNPRHAEVPVASPEGITVVTATAFARGSHTRSVP